MPPSFTAAALLTSGAMSGAGTAWTSTQAAVARAMGWVIATDPAYGATGDGTTDDGPAIQAAGVAAIAKKTALWLPAPASHYQVNTTITWQPPTGTQFALTIHGPAQLDTIQWGGTSGGSVFSIKGWKRSSVHNVNVRTAVACTVWDLDGDSTYTSLSQISWHDCNITTASTVALVGWRVGHTDPTHGCDFSMLGFYNCHFGGTRTAGQIMMQDEGGNALNFFWFGGECYQAQYAYSNAASAGAIGNGNGSKWFYGFGTSNVDTPFNIAVPGSYLISGGGRYELGTKFLNLSLGGSQSGAAIEVGNVEIAAFAPTDGQIFTVDGGSSLILRGTKVRPAVNNGTGTLNSTTAVTSVTGSFTVGQAIAGTGIPAGTTISAVGSGTLTLSQAATASASGITLTAAPDYTSAFITLNGSTLQRGYLLCEGCQWQVADPFFTITGSASWSTDLRGNRYIDPITHTVKRYRDALNVAGADSSDAFTVGGGYGSGTTVFYAIQPGDASVASQPRGRWGYNAQVQFESTAAGQVQLVDPGGTRSVALLSGSKAGVVVSADGQAVMKLGTRFSTTAPGAYPYTALVSDWCIKVDTTAARTISLLASATAGDGHFMVIKDASGKAGTNKVTITPNGTDTIDGVNASKTITRNGGALLLVADGAGGWQTLGGLANEAAWTRSAPAAVGQWYVNPLITLERSIVLALSTMYVYPMYSGPEGCTIDSFDLFVGTAGTASLCRVGIYTAINQDKPYKWIAGTAWGNLLLDAGTIATTSTGQLTLASGAFSGGQPIVIPPDTWFGVAGVEQGTTSATRQVGGSSSSLGYSPLGGAASGGYNTGPAVSLIVASVTGALPSIFTPAGSHGQNIDNGVGFHRSA